MAPLIPPAPVSGGKTLSPEEIAGFAKMAGFSGADLTIAVAVAIAESGGRTDIIGPVNSNGTRDYGVWQINSGHTALFAQTAQNRDWYQAFVNAEWAHTVFQGQGWSAWSAYKSGKYRQHMEVAQRAANNPQDLPIGTDDTAQVPDWLKPIIGPIFAIGNAMATIATAFYKSMVWAAKPANWVRASLVALGSGLVVGALVVLAKSSGATRVVKAVS